MSLLAVAVGAFGVTMAGPGQAAAAGIVALNNGKIIYTAGSSGVNSASITIFNERASTTWADFLRSQADALLACDFIETVTLNGQRQYILAAIEHATRRVRVLGVTAHLTASWVPHAFKNLVMDLENAGCRARYLIRDRDGKFP
jgi:hypothetical protein